MAGIIKIVPRETNLQADVATIVIPFGGTMGIKAIFSDKLSAAELKQLKKDIKWIWTPAENLPKILALDVAQKINCWGKWSNKKKIPITVYGIGIDYAMATAVNITEISKEKNNLGKKFWLEAFINYPEFNHPIGKMLTIKGDPAILDAKFEGTIKKGENIVCQYGKTVSIAITTHALPDYTLGFHNYVKLEVDFFHKGTKVTKSPDVHYINYADINGDNLNLDLNFEFLINEKWRGKIGHKEGTENYTAVIKASTIYNEDAVYMGEAKQRKGSYYSVGADFPVLAPNNEPVAVRMDWEDYEKVRGWTTREIQQKAAKNAARYKRTKPIEFTTTNEIEVIYITQGEAIALREVAAGNMFVEVKKQQFTCEAFDPCKFTAITVKAGSNDSVEIFNEECTNTEGEISSFSKPFSFVAADSKKEKVIITLKELSISDHNPGEGYKCYEAEEHSLKNIVDKKQALKQWLIEDGSPNPDKYSTYKVNGDTIELQMGYVYNKSYDSKVLDYLAYEQKYLKNGMLGEAIKNLWVIRYLLKMIKNEDLKQQYALPIATCRYPSQIIKLAVYPDLKWVLNFNYNIETPLYYKTTDATANYYSRFNHGIESNGKPKLVSSNSRERQKILDKEISNALVGYVGQKTSFEIGIQCQVGDSTPFDLNKLYEKKFQLMLAPLMWIHDFIDGTFGVSDAKQIDSKVKAKKAGKFNKLAKRLNRLPMSFELISPKIAMGLGIGFGNASNNNVGYELEGQLLMNPIIGANIKLDVLALGSKFKPWGAIINALDLVSWAADILSGGNLQLNYELYVQLTAKVLLVSSKSKDGAANPASLTYNFLDKKITSGDIGLQGVLEGKIVASSSLSYKLKREKGRKFSNSETKKSKDKKFELGLELEAKSTISLTFGGSFGKGDNFDADFYFSGVNVYVKIKWGFKGKSENFDILPDFDKTFDILKNKGEYK